MPDITKRQTRETEERQNNTRETTEVTPDFSFITQGLTYFPTELIPAGFVYAWGARAVEGHAMKEQVKRYERKGWHAVPSERHPDFPTEVGDLFLMERKVEFHKQEAAIYAAEQQKAQEAVSFVALDSTGLPYYTDRMQVTHTFGK